MIEGALTPTIGAVGNALCNSTKEFSITTLMALFLKDYYSNNTQDRNSIQKMTDNIDYFSGLLKMTYNFEPSTSKSTRNQAFTILKDFMNHVANEDNLKGQPLSFRSWF